MDEHDSIEDSRVRVKGWVDPLRVAAGVGLLVAFGLSVALSWHTGGGPVIATTVLLFSSGIILLGTLLASRRRTPRLAQALTGIYAAVVICAIVIGLAIPMIPYGRWRAYDQAAQSSLRNAVTAMKTIFCDDDSYHCPDTASLELVEPSLEWRVERSSQPTEIALFVPEDGISFSIAAMSGSGTCWFLRDSQKTGTTYGKSDDPDVPCTGEAAAAMARSPEAW